MSRMLPAGLLVLLVSGVGLSGCYEDTDVTLYEPGQYKGSSDPLLAKLRDGELRERLNRRFEQVQKDR
ncbi:hypothetical protein [Arhodomonas sp. SL1]|uniref:hypothetical protein n=1 Tax=Arhodomonas sp. SL1 TaxID=3425691 RepID=UPI003F883CD6